MNETVRQQLRLPSKGRVEVPKYTMNRVATPQKKKEGHDDLISRLRMRATITITTLDGAQIHGLLQESDRFTITVRMPELDSPVESAIESPERILLVYKHAIESFYLTKLNLDA